jgi:hypothetical protein
MTTNQLMWLDQDGLRVGGNQLLTSGGGVGIGTSSVYAALTVGDSATFFGNVGIGTITVGTDNKLAVFGGNIYVGSTNTGIVFADGTYQSTASSGVSGVTTFSAGTTGMTPTVAIGGAITLAFGAAATVAGIYSPTTNQIALSTASTARLLANANGNILIGTTTAPAGGNATVVIQSIGTNGGGIELASSTGGSNLAAVTGGGLVIGTFTGVVGSEAYQERMRIDTSGNVGIATNSITTGYKLQVNGIVADQSGNLRDIVNNSQSGAYILLSTDNGKMINITTGGVTLNTSIFTAGNTVTIFNNSASNQTITQGSGVTMYLAGSATTGNRTLAQRGICTIVCVVNSTTFVISGAGVT